MANNTKISDVSFTSLQKLDASGYYCAIDQNGIRGLNLLELNANNNEKIIDVSYMTNLRKLSASNNYGN